MAATKASLCARIDTTKQPNTVIKYEIRGQTAPAITCMSTNIYGVLAEVEGRDFAEAKGRLEEMIRVIPYYRFARRDLGLE